jgi:hypothetical protein
VNRLVTYALIVAIVMILVAAIVVTSIRGR